MADVLTGECPSIAAAANRSPKSWLHLAVGQRAAANSITHVCKWGCKFTGVSFDEVARHEATCKLKFTNASGQELSEGDLYMHYFQGKSREDIARVAAREVWGEESHERGFSLRDSLSPSPAKNVVSLEEEDQEENAGHSSRLLQHAGGSVNWLHDTYSAVLLSFGF
jgi:hypothetical protein